MKTILSICCLVLLSGALASHSHRIKSDVEDDVENDAEVQRRITHWRVLTNALNAEELAGDRPARDQDAEDSQENDGIARVRLYKQRTGRERKWEKLIKEAYKGWHAFKTKHGKSFETAEKEFEHMMTFLKTRQRVREHNAAYERGEKSYRMEINHLADLPDSDLHMVKGFNMALMGDRRASNASTFLQPLNFQAPDHVDWRDHGYVTDVKNQGMCGSCWSFSATGALEGQHKRKTGRLVSLSEQNLVDCSKSFGNNGCHGGLMDNAFRYIKANGGIDTERAYPYEAEDDRCRYTSATRGATDKGYQDITVDDENALKIAVASVGPVSVAIDAATPNRSFMQYKEGIYYEPTCNPEALDHGVLVVGYGTTEKGEDYWIVKNSWGTSWGEQGYIRMARNRQNNCGIASKASYPLV